jgi:S-methyl-5-thioribose-1-phosphate isomerase
MNVHGSPTRTVWRTGGTVHLIDQRLLPHTFATVALPSVEDTARAIEDMTVRGAGAIGATGALGLAQAAALASDADFFATVDAAAARLARTRPTAQNLFAGIGAVRAAVDAHRGDAAAARAAALAAGDAWADADAAACAAIGAHGAGLIGDGARVSTHCNAGWLAFVDWGSALSPVYAAHRAGRRVFVWVDETRPRGQGASLTAWELGQEGVPHAVIADNATASFMARGEVDLCIVGADRIAANGDVANKIGTLKLAIAAKHFGIPFYVAAPTPTIDPETASGAGIPIEERSEDEVRYTWGWSDDGRFVRVRTVPPAARARNPAFDVTPAALIRGIITEKGIVPATPEGIAQVAPPRRGTA